MSYLVSLCSCVLVFSPFTIAITSLGEEICLDLSVSSSSWCLGRAAVCDCGTPWTFLLPFFHASKTGLSLKVVSTYYFKAVPLLQFFFAYRSVVSYVAFVLLLFAPLILLEPRECCSL